MIPYRLQKTFLINIKIFKIWNILQLKIDKNKLEVAINKLTVWQTKRNI